MTPPQSMVSTRSARKKEAQAKMKAEQCSEASAAICGPSTVRTKKSSSSSSAARKKRLEFEAAEAKARIQIELIDKKLAADLAEVEENDSVSSFSKEQVEGKIPNDEAVEKWLESSRQECPEPPDDPPLNSMGPAGAQQHAPQNALEARPPLQGGTEDTVHALASALRDLAASSAGAGCPNGSNERLLSRLSTPRDLPTYSGDPLEWLHFKQAYEESSQVCKFNDKENLWRLRKYLAGPAKEAVTSLLIGATSPTVIMTSLELQFGNPDIIISRILQDIHRLRPMALEYHKDIIPFSLKIKNCVAAINAIGRAEYLQGMNIVAIILSKLPTVLISKWSDYGYPIINNSAKPKLVILSEFLSEEALKITKTSVNLCVQTTSRANQREHYNNRVQTILFSQDIQDSSNDKCRFCRVSKHPLVDCKKFKKALRKDRWTYVKRYGICFKCLSSQHKQNNCPAPVCDIDDCGLSHNRLLHYNVNKNSAQSSNSVNIIEVTENNAQAETVAQVKHNSCSVLLKTVPIYIHGPNGTVRSVALLDDGSTVTMISDSLASRVGLRGNKQSMRVNGAWENSELLCETEVINLIMSNSEGTKFNIRARSIKNLNLPTQSAAAVNLDDYELKPEIKNVISSGQCKPEMLIGQDNYELLLPLQIIKGKPTGPYLTRTLLGWCLHGCMRTSLTKMELKPLESVHCVHSASENTYDNSETERILREMHEEMRQSFAMESVGVTAKPRQNIEDVRACKHLESTAQLINGRWYVGLPWKSTTCEIPDSYLTAMTRLRGVEKKMSSNIGYAERYKERVDHLFRNDFASECKNEKQYTEKIWYLPHFGIDNPKKQKLRLVFDAAAKSQGMCLNDYLLKGPDLLISLYGVMLRFREYRIALTADIRDMFLRVKIIKEDRDALRFLWRESPEKPVKTYSMSSLIFGANCSPFIAQFIKNNNAEKYDLSMPAAAQVIRTQHYIDDYIDSCADEQTALKLVNDVTYIHKMGGFEIRNWTSNNPTVSTQSLPTVSFKNGQALDGERTLGLLWFPSDDTLGFDVSFKRIPTEILSAKRKPTKREMLRVIMSIFDVHGFLSPITIRAKIILQDTWRENINWDQRCQPYATKVGNTDWDDEITNTIFTKWSEWLCIVKSLENIRIPRYYNTAAMKRSCPAAGATSTSETHDAPSACAPDSEVCVGAGSYTNLQLHVFCDSSCKAMSVVAFWRWTDNENIYVAFICSKCRVAPVKYVSMPRLELQAAVMAARLAYTVQQEHRIKALKKYYWCDSSTVLTWIRNEARTYKAYVAHRLGEINELTKINEWRYVPTKMNVADIATRDSCDIKTLENEWLYGPSFLYKNETSWPAERNMQNTDRCNVDLECVNNIYITPLTLPAVPEPERFSSWLRLLRSTCVVITYIEKYYKKCTCDPDDPRIVERAENLLLKYSQMKAFPDELRLLQQGERLSKKSKLLTLTPVVNEDGLLRVGGRIDSAPDIPSHVKRPVILDGRCHVAHLLVKYYHVKAYHGNRETVVNEVKQKYWIIRLRPTVKYITSKCMLCRIKRARPQPPRMGDLPEARLAHHQRPFTYTGVDLFGPLEVTIGRRREKRYGVLFTCLTVRAVHIEIVSQLTTDSLIMALRRMAARRGWPRHLYSDNGTNLRGADSELKKCVQELEESDLRRETMTYSTETTWTFIPPASPHWGGAWERLIRSVKDALKVILRERAPRDETLHTLMTEVEHMVNSRPLTHVSVEPNTDESLTPNHFLLGTSSNLPTLGTFSDTDVYLRKQWRISQRLADMFWQRWVREVLPDMRPRQKWCQEEKPLQVGDVVIIVDPGSPRNTWPKGLIKEVLPGKDGRTRVVDVRTKTGVLRRPATRIARLPIGDECCASTREGDVSDAT